MSEKKKHSMDDCPDRSNTEALSDGEVQKLILCLGYARDKFGKSEDEKCFSKEEASTVISWAETIMLHYSLLLAVLELALFIDVKNGEIVFIPNKEKAGKLLKKLDVKNGGRQ